jgi:Ca-activated chloride channel family protein
VTQKGEKNTINHQYLNSTEKYLTGTYQLEIFTLPRTYEEISVSDKKTTIVDVPAAGTLNLRLKSPATGQLFIENKKGELEWVINLDPSSNSQKWNLQPGKYKVVYRGKKQYSSSYTQEKSFTIKSNNTIFLTL